MTQQLGRRHFATRAEARRAIFACINYYNHRRLHSACGYRPPAEYEQTLIAPPPEQTLRSAMPHKHGDRPSGEVQDGPASRRSKRVDFAVVHRGPTATGAFGAGDKSIYEDLKEAKS